MIKSFHHRDTEATEKTLFLNFAVTSVSQR